MIILWVDVVVRGNLQRQRVLTGVKRARGTEVNLVSEPSDRRGDGKKNETNGGMRNQREAND